jgi:hypothetical protein
VHEVSLYFSNAQRCIHFDQITLGAAGIGAAASSPAR